MADLHFDTYRRFALVPNDVWGLQDTFWNANTLILAGDLTNGAADRWAQVF